MYERQPRSRHVIDLPANDYAVMIVVYAVGRVFDIHRHHHQEAREGTTRPQDFAEVQELDRAPMTGCEVRAEDPPIYPRHLGLQTQIRGYVRRHGIEGAENL